MLIPLLEASLSERGRVIAYCEQFGSVGVRKLRGHHHVATLTQE